MGIGINTAETPVKVGNFALEEHNKLRRKHGLSDLHECPLMQAEAQQHAQKLAEGLVASEDFEPKGVDKYWSNVFLSNSADKEKSIKEAVNSKNFIDFLHPLVGSMGLGTAKSDTTNRWIIVIFYNAPKLCRGVQYRGSI